MQSNHGKYPNQAAPTEDNPMHESKSETVKANEVAVQTPYRKQLPRSCSTTCAVLSTLAVVAVIGIAVVIGVVLSNSDDGEDGADVAQDGFGMTASEFAASACPGPGADAAAAGTYQHFVQVGFGSSGTAPTCSDAGSMNNAAATAFGVPADRVVLSISDAARRLEASGTEGGLRRAQSTTLITQTLLATSEQEASSIAGLVEEAVIDGSIFELVANGTAGLQLSSPPGGRSMVSRGVFSTPVDQVTTPTPSVSPSSSPQASTTVRVDGRLACWCRVEACCS